MCVFGTDCCSSFDILYALFEREEIIKTNNGKDKSFEIVINDLFSLIFY